MASRAENARLYVRYRPTRLRLAVDPNLSIHRAYGVPKPVPTPVMMEEMAAVRINPDGLLPAPLPLQEAAEALSRIDGYTPTQATRWIWSVSGPSSRPNS